MRHFIVVAPVPAVTSPAYATSGPAAAAPPFIAGDAAAAHHAAHQARAKARVKQALTPAPVPDQILWQQQVEPVPAYPWGWFGARRHTENFGHRRAWDGYLDWSLGRGD